MTTTAGHDRDRRPAILVEMLLVGIGLLAVVALRFDTLTRTPTAAAAQPAVGGALVGTGLLLLATSPTVERVASHPLVTLAAVAAVVLGGGVLLDAVGDPDATFGLFGFLLGFGAGLVAHRAADDWPRA